MTNISIYKNKSSRSLSSSLRAQKKKLASAVAKKKSLASSLSKQNKTVQKTKSIITELSRRKLSKSKKSPNTLMKSFFF